jgi:hypothetical protein
MVGRLHPVRSMVSNSSKISFRPEKRSSQITTMFLVDDLPSSQGVDFYIRIS